MALPNEELIALLTDLESGSYEHTASPVRITWYSDRVEMISPGGPYGIVSADNFDRPGVTDYRNPALADLLRGLGYVQRFGMGLPSAHRSLKVEWKPAT